MRLRTKFNLVMGATFGLGLLLAGGLSYRMTREAALAEVLQEAGILAAQARAVSTYTAEEIAPLLREATQRFFLPQSVPFWASHSTSNHLQRELPDYSVRSVALNPTNPGNRPTEWQADIVNLFRADPGMAEHVGTRPSPNGPILSISRPIRVDSEACLSCHSTPQAAPAAMVDLYGAANGFGWSQGEVVGAQIVSVPVRLAAARASRTFWTVMAGLSGVFAVMMLVLNLLLHVVVLRPVRRMAETAEAVSLGQLDAPEFAMEGRDEIAVLAQSFNRMRRSFARAMRMLEA